MVFETLSENFTSERSSEKVSRNNSFIECILITSQLSLICNFINKRLRHRCFPVNFAKFFSTPILKNSCGSFYDIFRDIERDQWHGMGQEAKICRTNYIVMARHTKNKEWKCFKYLSGINKNMSTSCQLFFFKVNDRNFKLIW